MRVQSIIAYSFYIALGMCLISCDDPNAIPDIRAGEDVGIGFTSVGLDLNTIALRTQEALAGNLITDAMLYKSSQLGHNVDFAITNGGAIRFNSNVYPDGILPPGEVTRSDLLDILPFDNRMVVITVTGEEVKQILERSVADLPDNISPAGQFMQVSRGITFTVDLFNDAQIIDTNQNVPVIISPGSRVEAIMINGAAYQDRQEYVLVTNEFVASGGDGYATFAAIDASRKVTLDVLDRDAVEDYLTDNSPVSPIIESRINLVQ
ncbi:5'-nucleotidase C-terminal domain-containing protein [Pleionea sp. CnH1-48]|uniref:5'-nucleotidase C-terminal domain-containing protein n=1 Tax=Pleionea sp. CnH1-48 TaxID=2954494 RepID=UPI002097AF89|nr:5'-nucleotidase [Pleionea sp. CnH1-48]MCO7225981.1 5'-nucleotidase C-terminal domain-containing protein [Pleionea sp. CnH1-48]